MQLGVESATSVSLHRCLWQPQCVRVWLQLDDNRYDNKAAGLSTKKQRNSWESSTLGMSRVSCVALSLMYANSALSADQAPQQRDLETVFVTAQKREDRLQDVPVPVTALSASTLVAAEQTRLQDY